MKEKKINKKEVTYKIEESHTMHVAESPMVWYTSMDRLNIIRQGVPFASVESISRQLNTPIKELLNYLGIPQTTYNKKKREAALFDERDGEVILLLQELIDFGIEVFNGEEDKFQRWLKKPNVSLGGVTPESLFDTNTGIDEVKKALTRIEYGIFA